MKLIGNRNEIAWHSKRTVWQRNELSGKESKLFGIRNEAVWTADTQLNRRSTNNWSNANRH